MKDNTKRSGEPYQYIDAPRDIDIEEVVTPPESSEDAVLDGGAIDAWKHPEDLEKAELRRYITCVVMLFWIFWTVTSLIRFFVTGDVSLLIISPVMISIPLLKMLHYYFGKD